LKFGILIFGDNHPDLGRSNQKYYEEVLTIAEWAGDLGFDSFWLGEHHLYWYRTCVSPAMVIALLGQCTKRIRLGPAVAVLPFHNPLVVVAEEYAFADNLAAAGWTSQPARLLASGVQHIRHDDGGSERKILGGVRHCFEGMDARKVFASPVSNVQDSF
jgi:hypothetical protein